MAPVVLKKQTDRQDYEGFLPACRGMCDLGKFRATGWRNASIWEFLGLLGLAGGIALASCETENRDLQ